MVLNLDRDGPKMLPPQFCIILLNSRPSYLPRVKFVIIYSISFPDVLSLIKKISNYVSVLPHFYPPKHQNS